MKVAISLLILAAALPLAYVEEAEACSPANDSADIPETLQVYDANRGIPTPSIEMAEFYHSDDSAGCPGNAGCGSISGLRVVMELPANASQYTLRVEDEHGHVGYAYPSENMYLFNFGEEVHPSDSELQISLIDSEGYPSEEVKLVASGVPDEEGGCSTSKGLPKTSSVLLALLAFMGIRRSSRRRA